MVDDFSGPREYRPTQPFDPDDPPRFGQLIETTKDAFASEIRRFFDYRSDDIRAKIGEFPAIEKFAHMGTNNTTQSMETVMNFIMSFGDTPDKFPMVVITSANAKEKALGLGDVHAVTNQTLPRLTAENGGPYDLSPGWELHIRTWPLGLDNDPVDTVILFEDILFPDIHSATVDDVIQAINAQVLYTHAQKNGTGQLQIVSGGPAAHGTPNAMEVIGGTPDCLLALGYKTGQYVTYLDYEVNPPYRRYAVAADLTINIDVVADSLNTRTALADLVYDFFTFYMSRQFFQMLGRSYDDPELSPPEWFQIILKREFTWAGEYNVPRQGGEQQAFIHSIRGSVPVVTADFVDRPFNRGEYTFIRETDLVSTEELPQGDYFGANYLKIG